MGVKTYKKYSDEYKLAAVRAVENGTSVPEVSRTSGVSKSTLYGWLEELSKQVRNEMHPEGDGGERKGVLREWRRFDDEFKMMAVAEIEAGKKTVPELAKELGIDKATLYKWRQDFRKQNGGASQPSRGDAAELLEKLEAAAEENQRAREEQAVAAGEEKARVKEMIADPLIWLQQHTKTKDSHWQEAGADGPYRPFPEKAYFRPIVETFQTEPVLFIEKSRDMMLSWLCVGLFTHAAMTIEGIEVLFQSQNADKALELVQYAKTLYSRQKAEIQKAFPLARSLRYMADGELVFAHGSRIIGIPGGGDQIRSYHPWGLFQDEAAFMPEAGEAYDNAIPVCQKIVVLSSAGPGWFADVCSSAE